MYNSGNIDLYNKNSAIFFLNPSNVFTDVITGNYRTNYVVGDTKPLRPITAVNRNEMKIYGENSVGIFVKTPVELTTDFTDETAGTTFKPMTIYGDNSIGLYVQKLATNERTKINGNFAVNIGDSSNTGNQNYVSAATKATLSSIGVGATTGNPLNYNLNN